VLFAENIVAFVSEAQDDTVGNFTNLAEVLLNRGFLTPWWATDVYHGLSVESYCVLTRFDSALAARVIKMLMPVLLKPRQRKLLQEDWSTKIIWKQETWAFDRLTN
jgi:hypothetical protein